MPTIDFDGASEVIYDGGNVDAIYLGSELVWGKAVDGFDSSIPIPKFTLAKSATGIDLKIVNQFFPRDWLVTVKYELELSDDGRSTWRLAGKAFDGYAVGRSFVPASHGLLWYRLRFVDGTRYGAWSSEVSINY